MYTFGKVLVISLCSPCRVAQTRLPPEDYAKASSVWCTELSLRITKASEHVAHAEASLPLRLHTRGLRRAHEFAIDVHVFFDLIRAANCKLAPGAAKVPRFSGILVDLATVARATLDSNCTRRFDFCTCRRWRKVKNYKRKGIPIARIDFGLRCKHTCLFWRKKRGKLAEVFR